MEGENRSETVGIFLVLITKFVGADTGSISCLGGG